MAALPPLPLMVERSWQEQLATAINDTRETVALTRETIKDSRNCMRAADRVLRRW